MGHVTDTFPAIPQTPPPPQRQQPPPRRRRRRGSPLRRTLLFVLVSAVLLVFAAIAYLDMTAGRIERIASTELVSLATTVPAAANEPAAPVNFLVIATDDRSNLPDDWDDHFGDFAGRRTDVIMLAHMIPGQRIQLLSIPRDLMVDIDGHGTNRINASFVVGGPDLLVRTVQQETGIPVHHYVEIDFGGFASIVDSLGGVELYFPYPSRDKKSGLDVAAGTRKLDGEMAVAYARSRQMEIKKDGSWQPHNTGDVARTQRQQEIMVALFSQVTSAGSAFNLPGFLPTLADNIKADEGLGLGLMAELGRAALGLSADDVERATLPVKSHSGSDGRSYVIPSEDAAAFLEAFLVGDPYPASR